MAKCFVIMPFGKKRDFDGVLIDFDKVYRDLIKGALEPLGFEVERADRISGSGSIHKDMIHGISTSEVCVVDLTTLNANVFYELGVRHALCRGITILIKRKGLKPPFNIQGMRALDYSMDPKGIDDSREDIARFVRHGQKREATPDSLVFHVLPDLNVKIAKDKVVQPIRRVRYPVRGQRGRYIGLIGGDISKVDGMPVWVNSENTNMQMARFYDRSVSSTIRNLGAKKHLGDPVDDPIADDLRSQLAGKKSVEPATTIKTTPGELAKHGVKCIVHVAAVHGTAGHGYEPIKELDQCIHNVLQMIDDDEGLKPKTSVLFPLLGTGTASGKVEELAPQLIEAAINYMKNARNTIVERIYFSAYYVQYWDVCERLLEGMRVEGLLGRRINENRG
jgi:O-acetyl-ADP-ribose deacetylase (regulator of RNase III)